ncbi:hypothetical protein ACFWA9_09960 [Kitasatospora sp. NPDC059973]|uniref:hypothetical protein n=1 Tax=Kitasatospora sp. NPDC059973 TaxID=3347020 RepID=UPI0036A84C70
MVVVYCKECCAIAIADSPEEASYCPHCGSSKHATITGAGIAATLDLVEMMGDGYWLMDVSNSSAGMTCTEAGILCDFLREFGRYGIADDLLKDHASHDDEGDSHGLDERGEVFTRE